VSGATARTVVVMMVAWLPCPAAGARGPRSALDDRSPHASGALAKCSCDALVLAASAADTPCERRQTQGIPLLCCDASARATLPLVG
jgi:hypothetical protein